MSACRICGSPQLRVFEAREMFLGTRERFTYEDCAGCGTLQRADVPEDLSALYPPRYFEVVSFGDVPLDVWLGLRNFTGVAARCLLDVGCATGALLTRVASIRVRATGVDPYAPITEAQARARGWTLVRSLDDVEGSFDMVLASHVLEHVPDPQATLKTLVSRLSPRGRLAIMMPFACSPLARQYGPAWIGLDPGRHLHVFTRPTFVGLAEELGLEVMQTEDQTTALSIAMSEAWAQDISWNEFASRLPASDAVSRWEPQAAALRRAGYGDCWAFALRRREAA